MSDQLSAAQNRLCAQIECLERLDRLRARIVELARLADGKPARPQQENPAHLCTLRRKLRPRARVRIASHRIASHAAHLCACKREVRRHALQPHALRATLASGTKMAYSCGLPERRSCTARASGTGIGGRKPGHFFCSFTTRAMSMNASKRYSVSHGPPRACAGQRHAIPRHSAARSATRQRARSPAVYPSRDWPRLVEPSRAESSRAEPSRAETRLAGG